MSQETVARPRPTTLRKQERVRAEARRLFTERGYERTTMDAIAAAARVSKQTLYSYYPDKAALFIAVIRSASVERPANRQAPGPAILDPVTEPALASALTQLLVWIVDGMLEPGYLALLRVVIAESGRFPELASEFRQAVPDRGLATVRAILGEAAARRLVDPAVIDLAARGFLGSAVAYLGYDGLLGGRGPRPTEAELRRHVDLFLRGCLRRTASVSGEEAG
jgi:TetR/AcrR family transcriptional repressor of mexJK operon